MTKSLKETLFLVGLVPFAITGILLLCGAGIFSFGVGYVLMSIGERIVKSRKQKAVQAVYTKPEDTLSLVEMDVAMRFRDKSVDLRVVN